MNKNDKIDRLTEELDSLRCNHFSNILNTGYFLSKKLFFVFGVDILLEEVKVKVPDCKYVKIENYAELEYFVKALDIYKSKSFIERVKVNNPENKFPVFLELNIFKDTNSMKLSKDSFHHTTTHN
jgi:hypothetical protein